MKITQSSLVLATILDNFINGAALWYVWNHIPIEYFSERPITFLCSFVFIWFSRGLWAHIRGAYLPDWEVTE